MKTITSLALFTVLYLGGFGQCNELGKGNMKVSVLIVGENNYPVDDLENSVNDAIDIARSMGRLKFKVKLDTNSDLAKLKFDIEQWTISLNDTVDVAIFYFAGHGSEIGGENYLYPTSANPTERNGDRIRTATYPVSFLLDRMETFNKKVNVVILDACRNDPTRGVINSPVGHGLANMKSISQGVLVAFPVGAGKKTPDGGGNGNSNYAFAIVKNLESPNLSITDFFGRVHDDVVQLSKYKDSPYISSSIGAQSDICLCCIPIESNRTLGLSHGDTIYSETFQQFRDQAITRPSAQRRHKMVADTFAAAEEVIRSSVQAILDSIKNSCNCQMAHPGQTNEYRAEKFTSRVGFANVPYGDDLFYPTMTGEIKDNVFYFTIYGETYVWPKLVQLEKEKLLASKIVRAYSIYSINWQEISNTIKAYLSQRLNMLLIN